MWTRAPTITSCCLTLDHEDDVGEANCFPRDHHRGSSSSNHHQPGEQDLVVLLLQGTQPTESAPLHFHILLAESPTTTIHHDLPKPPGSSKRLPTSTTRAGFISGFTRNKLSPMSTRELDSVVVARVRQLQPPPDLAQTSAHRVSKEKPQLDDMQTQIASSSSCDQEVSLGSTLLLLSKRRRLVLYNVDESEAVRSPEECEDSGLTAEQHMVDLDRTSKSSSPEDIDSATATTTAAARVSTSELAPVPPQCSTFPGNQQVVEQENVVDGQVLHLSEPLQVLEHLHSFSSSQQSVVIPSTSSPGDDETQHSTVSQFLPPTGHRVPDSQPTRNTTTKTMARSGGDEWLQLSLGGGRSQSDHEEPSITEEQPTSTRVPLEIYQQSNPSTSNTTPDPPGTRDFFKLGTSEMEEATSSHRHPSSTTSATPRNLSASPYSGLHSGESSKPQKYHSVSEPSTTHRSTGILPRPLFLEPGIGVVPPPPPRSDWLDPNAPTPRGLPDRVPDQFLVGSPVLQEGSFTPQQFSNLSFLPYQPARVFQSVRSEPIETTAVHAWRAGGYDAAGPSSSRPHYASPSSAPWMQPGGMQPEFASMGSTVAGAAFQDWRSTGAPILSMQPPLGPQGVDPEQAWRNLLQRVGNTVVNVQPSGAFGASTSSSSGAHMLRPGEREEYLDSLKRAVERFQGADQGEAPTVTELQRLSRSAMFPPGQGQGQQQQQGPHPGLGLGLQAFDPSREITRFYTAPSSSGSKPRTSAAPAGPGSSSRRILRPHAPRPGLWFTLQASSSPSRSSQPERTEASPLRQIPTAYIRVVDDTMTVAAVRTYLANKLGLSEDEVELTCKGQPLQPGISLQQVRDGIWQSPNTNPEPHPNTNTSQLLSEGKAWKAPDGSITLVGDVVMVLTYGRRPPTPSRGFNPVSELVREDA